MLNYSIKQWLRLFLLEYFVQTNMGIIMMNALLKYIDLLVTYYNISGGFS